MSDVSREIRGNNPRIPPCFMRADTVVLFDTVRREDCAGREQSSNSGQQHVIVREQSQQRLPAFSGTMPLDPSGARADTAHEEAELG
jgi:hypothetical protein